MSAIEIIILMMMANILVAGVAGLATAGHEGLSILLEIISWITAIATAVMMVFMSVTFTSMTLFAMCLAIVVRQAVAFITSAIVNGKEKKDMPVYFNGAWFLSTGLVGVVGVIALITAGVTAALRVTGVIAG